MYMHFIGEMMGLPYLPAYVNTLSDGCNVSSGVNYGSAAAGILDETGQILVISISKLDHKSLAKK